MKKSDALKQERHALNEKQQALINLAKDEKRDFTPAEESEFDARVDEIRAFDAKIKRAEEVEATELRTRLADVKPVDAGVGNGEERELNGMKGRYSLHKALRSLTAGGEKLDGIEAEIHQETKRQAQQAGVAINGVAVPMFNRVTGQTVTDDAGGYGSKLVSTDKQSIIEYLRPKPVLEAMGATFLTGLTGNLEFPVNDGGITTNWLAETAAISNSKNAYSARTMSPKRLGAAVQISLQNLMQSSYDLEAYTMNEIAAAIANSIDVAGINGAGSATVPLGILNTLGVGSVVGGANGAAPTWSNIVDLETAVFVANANSAKMGYLINPKTKGKLKQTKHQAGDANYLMDLNNQINGYNVGVSNLVPSDLTKGTSAGVCSAGIFGDFSQLLIGQWAFMDMSVDENTGKKNGYVEVVANSFLDILVRQPKSFVVIKDWLTA